MQTPLQPVKRGGVYHVRFHVPADLWNARDGSGFVLEFNTKNCAICWDASPIDYVDRFPKIKLYAAAMAGTMWKDMLRVPLTKIREPWWREREWRTWRIIPGFYRYQPDSLVSITFGPNIEDDLVNTLFAIVVSKYWPGAHVYEAKIINGQLVRIPTL